MTHLMGRNGLLGRRGVKRDALRIGQAPQRTQEAIPAHLRPRSFAISATFSFADPGEAHRGYDRDERVISLIARGIGNENVAEIVKERCTWLETTENGF